MALTPNNAGAKDVGNGAGQQFTTGGCVSDADCRSTCCAEISTTGVGICSAVGAATQNGKTGCGFVDPNSAVCCVSKNDGILRVANFFVIGYYCGCQVPGC